jgi:hypothetical protein
MKRVNLVLLVLAIVGVISLSSAAPKILAKQGGAEQKANNLPPDIYPETLTRIQQAHRDEFSSEEDKQAYDHLVSVEPRFGKPSMGPLGGTGIRLHLPVVADAYRTAWNDLRDNSGVERKYMELATLVACRETDLELEWVAHEKPAEQLNSKNVVEIIRNKQEPTGLEEKQQAIIQFGREMFERPTVSSATFARMQSLFGQRGTLGIALMMAYYANNAFLFRAYDQRLDPGTKRPFADVIAKEKQESSK